MMFTLFDLPPAIELPAKISGRNWPKIRKYTKTPKLKKVAKSKVKKLMAKASRKRNR